MAIAKFSQADQIRIFDSNGDIVIDKQNEDFTLNTILRQKIDSALTQSPINSQTASEIIDEITFTIGLSE
ncbi:MAG: hypothetical protein AAFQ91_14950 [Cyanobacteria bacterium J06621_15]